MIGWRLEIERIELEGHDRQFGEGKFDPALLTWSSAPTRDRFTSRKVGETSRFQHISIHSQPRCLIPTRLCCRRRPSELRYHLTYELTPSFHVHVRQGAMSKLVVPHVAQGGIRTAYVMVRDSPFSQI